MKKITFIIIIVFTFCSCVSEDAGFKSYTRKEIMNSWVWKTFIYTDLGEFKPIESAPKRFDNNTKVSSIFVENSFGFYHNNDLFLSNQSGVFNKHIIFPQF